MIIGSSRVWVSGGFIPARIEVSGGKISGVLAHGGHMDEDFGDRRIFPGFIDVHTHGCFGIDANDSGTGELREWARGIAAEGVTAFLPTTVTQRIEALEASLKNINEAASTGSGGAEILGAHLEGPFINPKFKGAHIEEFVTKPDVAQFKRLQDAAGGNIRLVTLACEQDDGFALTRYCAANGVSVSIGHSGAAFEQAREAAANGAVSMTHVYNAMTAYNHRAPGLVGAALYMPGFFGEIIADCIHSHPAAVANLFRAKDPGHVVAITDSLSAKACGEGTFSLGGETIEIYADGSAHLTNGTLAGSTLSMNIALKNLITRVLVPVEAAVNACTLNPARLLRIDSRKGRIAANYDADLAVLNEDYSVAATYCLGRQAYSADS